MDVRVVKKQKCPFLLSTAEARRNAPHRAGDSPMAEFALRWREPAPEATGCRSGTIRYYVEGVGLARIGATGHPGGVVEVVGHADM